VPRTRLRKVRPHGGQPDVVGPATPPAVVPTPEGGPGREVPLTFIADALADAKGDVEEAAVIILDTASPSLLEARAVREDFRAGILDQWGASIDGLDLLVSASLDAGDEWDRRSGPPGLR
jgi:hypothetical protein